MKCQADGELLLERKSFIGFAVWPLHPAECVTEACRSDYAQGCAYAIAY